MIPLIYGKKHQQLMIYHAKGGNGLKGSSLPRAHGCNALSNSLENEVSIKENNVLFDGARNFF